MTRKIDKKLAEIRLLLLDVDGVLTEGDIVYTDEKIEIKRFDVKDGLGLRLLMDAGVGVGIVTGRRSKSLVHRCENLGVTLIFDGVKDKAALLDDIKKRTGVLFQQMAFVGDDLPDMPIMNEVGLSIAVSNAHEIVRDNADMVTLTKGGRGAVREVCEAILKAKGLWEKAIETFTVTRKEKK